MKVVLILCLALSEASAVSACSDECCPTGWTHWGGHCYRYFNQPRLNFAASEDHCNTFLFDEETCPCKRAHLVKVDSEAENNFLWNWWKTMREPISDRQHVRIGYTDSNSEGHWVWEVDGTTGSYSKWGGGQPDNFRGHQDCAVMWKGSSDTGAWDDEGCGAARAFFCEFSL